MAYNNLANQQTSVSATWGDVKNTGLSYSILTLDSGVPHVDQIEVERVFSSTELQAIRQSIDPYDLHQLFLLNKTEYTLDETTSKLTSLSGITGNRVYTFTRGALASTSISIRAFEDSDLVIIRRKTLSMTPYVTWVSGTRLTSAQLNQQVKQLLRLNQELIYKMETEYVRVTDISGTTAPSLTLNNDLNVNSYKIANLSMPSGTFSSSLGSNGGYAVNKSYVDTNFVNLSTAQTIGGAKTFSGAAVLSSTLGVTGATTLSSTLGVTGATTLSSTLDVTGATTLNSNLSVSGLTTLSSGAVDETLRLAATGINGPYISFYRSGTRKAYIQQAQSLLYVSNEDASATIAFGTTGLERMRIDSSGRVGIGTNNPGYKLTLSSLPSPGTPQGVGTDGTVIQTFSYQTSGNVAYSGTLSNHPFGFLTNNTTRMFIDATGSVGIGNSSPNYKLAVTGTLGVSGDTVLAGTTASTSTTTGALTVAGGVGVAGNLNVGGGSLGITPASGNAGIELGALGVSSTPFIDFHSSSTNNDYDSRIIASGGNTTTGNGLLNIQAGAVGINKTSPVAALDVTGTVAATGVITANSGGTVGGASAPATLIVGTASSIGIYVTSAAPNFSAAKGSICINTGAVTTATTNTRLYINTNGSTGWAAITTAA